MEKKTRLILFWGILALSLFARVWQFGAVPADLNQDEAFAGYNAYTLLTQGRDSFGYAFPMYLTAWGSGMNALESYLAIPFILLFGCHTWVLRLVPLICSMLAIPAVYCMLREHLGDDRFALFAMLLVGVMPWPIMISRWALESNLTPSFLVFGAFFFLKGTKDERWYILSALFYGLTLYCYTVVWIALPLILLAEIVAAVVLKKLRFSRYTLLAGAVLFLFGLPAVLFLLVNNGVIEEIRTPVFSIPRMVSYRDSYVTLSSIPENFSTLLQTLSAQSDDMLYNCTEEFGLFYHFSAPFLLIGLILAVLPLVLRKRDGRNLLRILLLAHLVAGIVVGVLVYPNINRINLLMFPLILLIAWGWYALFHDREWFGVRLRFVPVAFYLVCFLLFERHYFTTYSQDIHGIFQHGIEPSMAFVNENLEDVDRVYVAPTASYSKILFLTRQDLDEYLDTVVYTNYPDPYLDVSSFGRFDFTVDGSDAPDGHSAYVLDSFFNETPLVEALNQSSYGQFRSDGWTVYYPQ